ncbi:MAG: hypothetical protein ACJAZM_001281 [Cyclobacteriaceae bacterium]|jgi:hypothetical protein
MLVSHDYKFIFIKPKKVAGTSIQYYLARYCENGIIYNEDPKSHMAASQVRDLIGNDLWASYLKITVVRNPWDKTVSLYHWRRRKRPFYNHLGRILKGWPWHSPARRHNFKDFVQLMFEKNTLNEDVAITQLTEGTPDYFYIRFEHMHEDMQSLCEQLGVTYQPEEMPKKKVGYRDSKSYREYYDDASKEHVRAAYADVVERFGYEF